VLIHRPKYDDWSFPKGKLNNGEHLLAAAVRETAEETGLQVRLGPPVAVQTYPITGNGTKQVHYWAAQQSCDSEVTSYLPNAEIDEVTWLPVAKARKRLTYPRDTDVLEAFLDSPFRARPLVILRHAAARPRSSWRRADLARTLTEAGRVQARRLVPLLEAYDVQRILTSDAVRCAATVAPFAEESLVEYQADHRLSEEGMDRVAIRRVMRRLLKTKARAVVCSHRPVLPEVFGAVGLDDPKLKPGHFLVVHHRGGKVRAIEEHEV
jgi:8-oxo-dGTP diphosphatase